MAARPNPFSNADTIDAPLPAESDTPADRATDGNVTVDSAASDSLAILRAAGRRPIALFEGSAPHLTTETQQVLRSRLRTVAILFFSGFLSFFTWSLFWLDWYDQTGNWYIFWLHLAVTGLLGVMGISLCRKCVHSTAKLRVFEAIIFGAPAAFFVVLNHNQLAFCCELPGERAFVPNTIASWIILLLTYAMFIPNNWRRALAVMAPMAIAPVAVLYSMWLSADKMAQLLSQSEFRGLLVEQPLVMGLTLAAGTIGVHTINTLRREAFEAKQLGHYRLKHRIGSGGMGEVYLAEHQMMKRPCAVKLIRPEKAGDSRTLGRFEREVRTTAKLSHWNSIDIFDYGRTDDGTFYYVMEYLPGHNIGELVERHGPLPPARIVHLMIQVCSALSEAHAIGLVHRDIKPANIFSAFRGGMFDVAKLLDFGLAKPMTDTSEVSVTQEGAITGSPLYMSPEQATADEDADVRSDIYSLGAVMYYMLTGQPPFIREKPLAVMIAHASEPVVPPREIRPSVPPDLGAVVMRCLEKRPQNRFQTAAELTAALDRADLYDGWDSIAAAEWWEIHGCPVRKAIAARALEAAAV